MNEELRKKARELLEAGAADVVIGYGASSLPGRTTPVFITKPEDVEKLIVNEYIHNNLAIYLTSKPHRKFAKKAIVAKPCDIKSIVALIAENQIERDSVYIIGVACDGIKDADTGELLEKCAYCPKHNPDFCDATIGNSSVADKPQDAEFDMLRKIESMSPDERWEFWTKQFEKCIRCYACRQVCPMCYCDRCVAYKTMPQWMSSSAHPKGNLSWHIFRAMHSAGRCIGCSECERVCPSGIPVALLYRKMAKEVEDNYGFEAGCAADAKPAMCDFRNEDSEDFIR